jgi:lysophospholipase L1-like esterase
MPPSSSATGARRVLLVALLVATLAACGGGDDEQTRGEPTATTDEAPRTTTTTSVTTTTEAPTTSAAEPLVALPPTSAPPTGQAQATSAALQFLTEAESAMVTRTCNAAQPNVRVDHPGATQRIGVIGDSLTVQVVDRLVADTRFNWSISAMCGARGDHYAGGALLGGAMNVRGAYDVVLADQPDVLLVALGTNDVLDEVYTNVPRDIASSIQEILRSADPLACRSWINVHTPVRPGAPYGPEYRWDHYAPHYNSTIDAYVGAGWTQVADWDAIVRRGTPDQLLLSDGIHLSEGGKAARTQLLLDTAAGLAASCGTPPPTPPTDSPIAQ